MAEGKTEYQRSWVTIFSIWNTMMGTTLLAIPWAIAQAGFALGVFLTVLVSAICYYTCSIVIRLAEEVRKNQIDGSPEVTDLSEICRYYMGKRISTVVVVFSIMTLMIAGIAFWILMSGFLFEIGQSVTVFIVMANGSSEASRSDELPESSFWTPTFIPLYLAGFMYPLTLFRRPTFFTKLNSAGVVSVLYLIAMVAVKAGIWGVNLDYANDSSLRDFRKGFPSLIGTMTMGFFLQNAVLSLTNPAEPRTRTRSLMLGYILVLLTYLYIGITMYLVFPGDKKDLKDNFLENFPSSDILIFVARIGLLFQMITIFPLLAFIMRVQVVKTLLGKDENGIFGRIFTGIFLITAGVLLAIFFPNIGVVLRISGAVAGLTLAYTLPCVVYLAYLRREGRSSKAAVWAHLLIIAFGLFNFLSQFLI